MLYVDKRKLPKLNFVRLEAFERGIQAFTLTGERAHLAVVDDSGNVLESGDDLERALWWMMVDAHNRFLEGLGHIKRLTPHPQEYESEAIPVPLKRKSKRV